MLAAAPEPASRRHMAARSDSLNTPAEHPSEPRFPFTAIVGQADMKLALLLNTINPKIGGVLIRGKKGTAKSTAVRSLAALLPCRFSERWNRSYSGWSRAIRSSFLSRSRFSSASASWQATFRRGRRPKSTPLSRSGLTESRRRGSTAKT